MATSRVNRALNCFPAEILRLILDGLDTPDLAAAARCCKTFFPMANHLLYPDEVTWELPRRWIKAGSHLVRLALFLRTLLECPRRAQKIRRLQITFPASWDYSALNGCDHYAESNEVRDVEKNLQTHGVEGDLQTLCGPFLERMRAQERSPCSLRPDSDASNARNDWYGRPDRYNDNGLPQWERALSKLDLTAVVSVIVWVCPNIESIMVSRPLLFNNALFMNMLLAELTSSSPREEPWRLGNIRSVITPFDDYWGPLYEGKPAYSVKPQDFLAFFHLPKLKTLDLGVPYSNHDCGFGNLLTGILDIASYDESRLEPTPQHLTKLRLAFFSAPFTDGVLHTLLPWTFQLRHLNLRFNMCDVPLNAKDLSSALENVAGTLETLEIRLTIRQLHIFETLEEVVGEGLESLRHLTALKSLNVSLPFLQEYLLDENRFTPLANVLPPNLECLTVNNDLCKKSRQTYSGLRWEHGDWPHRWGRGDWSCRWGNAARLMQFFGGLRLVGARRRTSEGEIVDENFDRPGNLYDEDEDGGVFGELEDALWVEALWEREAVKPPWKTATPKLRRLVLMGPISKLLPGAGDIGRKLKAELKTICEDQGLEVTITGPHHSPREWIVEDGDERWPSYRHLDGERYHSFSGDEWVTDDDGTTDDEWDSDGF